jgi:hypothetical protein
MKTDGNSDGIEDDSNATDFGLYVLIYLSNF